MIFNTFAIRYASSGEIIRPEIKIRHVKTHEEQKFTPDMKLHNGLFFIFFLPDGNISLHLFDKPRWFWRWYRRRWRSTSVTILKLKIRHGRSVVHRCRLILVKLRWCITIYRNVRYILQRLPLLLQLFSQLHLTLLTIRHVCPLTLQFFLLELQELTLHAQYLLITQYSHFVKFYI